MSEAPQLHIDVEMQSATEQVPVNLPGHDETGLPEMRQNHSLAEKYSTVRQLGSRPVSELVMLPDGTVTRSDDVSLEGVHSHK